MAKSKVKLTESKPKSSVFSLEDIIEMDWNKRLEVAQEFDNAGYFANCHYIRTEAGPVEGAGPLKKQKLIGLGSAYDRNTYVFRHLCEQFPESVRHKISQLVRIKDDDGNERLLISTVSYCRDYIGNEISHSYTLGKVDRPKFFIGYDGFDPKTGKPIESGKELNGFTTEYYIPFSEAQIKALEKQFGKVNLIIHTGSRKYTVETLEDFCKDFSELKAQVAPKPKAV